MPFFPKSRESGQVLLGDRLLTHIVESSFGQLVGPNWDARGPVDEGEQPLVALLHGRVRHVTERGRSRGQLRCYSCSCGCGCGCGQWQVIGSVAPHKAAVGIMSLVLRRGSVPRGPVAQLQRQTGQKTLELWQTGD